MFYAVVQVGGFVPSESELGRAARPVLGADFPIVTSDEGDKLLFAADLYYWWLENAQSFDSFPLLEDWLQREFTTSTVIPMYESLRTAD